MTKSVIVLAGAVALSLNVARAGTDATHPSHGLPPDLAQYDTDGDGKLSDAEKAAMKAALEAKRKAFIAKYDANGDGVLDATELAKAKADLDAQRKAERTKQFADLDKDGNGSLTLEEFSASLTGASATRIAAAFNRLDTNGDKAISLDEFTAVPTPPGPGAGGPHPGRHH